MVVYSFLSTVDGFHYPAPGGFGSFFGRLGRGDRWLIEAEFFEAGFEFVQPVFDGFGGGGRIGVVADHLDEVGGGVMDVGLGADPGEPGGEVGFVATGFEGFKGQPFGGGGRDSMKD